MHENAPVENRATPLASSSSNRKIVRLSLLLFSTLYRSSFFLSVSVPLPFVWNIFPKCFINIRRNWCYSAIISVRYSQATFSLFGFTPRLCRFQKICFERFKRLLLPFWVISMRCMNVCICVLLLPNDAEKALCKETRVWWENFHVMLFIWLFNFHLPYLNTIQFFFLTHIHVFSFAHSLFVCWNKRT